MLHIFSTNRVKLTARKPKATHNLGPREYVFLTVTSADVLDFALTTRVSRCCLDWIWVRACLVPKFFGFQLL